MILDCAAGKPRELMGDDAQRMASEALRDEASDRDPALLLRASLLAQVRPGEGAAPAAPDEQRRADLLAAAGEDLRAPIEALRRQIARIRREAESLSPSVLRTLSSMERQANRAAAVAEALTALAALDAGRIQLLRESVDLGELLRAGVATAGASATSRGVELVVELPPAPLRVSADRSRMREVVDALLASALAVTAPGAVVRIAAEGAPEGVRVTVEDGRPAGSGAPQAAARPAERLAGLGLVTAVCRGLAELHGGSLDVRASATGRSARLTLPLEAAPEAPRPVPPASTAEREGKARLLVVDDDPDAREALAMTLAEDYEVELAGDGQEAIDSAVASRPDLVLMDLYMPRLDGMAALEALRVDPRTSDVPVIFISGRGDELTRSRTLDLGAVDFLQKPFSGRELKSRIERTLRSARRETHLQELARTDPLTGLANVRAFRARLEEEVKRAHRYHTPLACVMVDMDRLKPINDELGHVAGDVAIASLAELIRRELRETDFGARYGGDEFVVLLPHTSAGEARIFAERVRARLRESQVHVHGHRLPLAASFGVGALGDDPPDETGEQMVRRADAALYAAKRAGRDGVVEDGGLKA